MPWVEVNLHTGDVQVHTEESLIKRLEAMSMPTKVVLQSGDWTDRSIRFFLCGEDSLRKRCGRITVARPTGAWGMEEERTTWKL